MNRGYEIKNHKRIKIIVLLALVVLALFAICFICNKFVNRDTFKETDTPSVSVFGEISNEVFDETISKFTAKTYNSEG